MVPVGERIAEKVFQRLQRLAAGFSSNTIVSEVIRPKMFNEETPKHNQIVLVSGDLEIDEALSHPGNPAATAWVQHFHIHCHVIPSEKDPTPVETYFAYLLADVRKVLTAPTAWHNWDELAINTVFRNPERALPTGGFARITLPMLVTYRTPENDPYTVRG